MPEQFLLLKPFPPAGTKVAQRENWRLDTSELRKRSIAGDFVSQNVETGGNTTTILM